MPASEEETLTQEEATPSTQGEAALAPEEETMVLEPALEVEGSTPDIKVDEEETSCDVCTQTPRQESSQVKEERWSRKQEKEDALLSAHAHYQARPATIATSEQPEDCHQVFQG